jgi:hypothetical protein
VSSEFLVGANLPWIRYGCDFGANAWQPDGGLSAPGRRDAARESLEALASSGARVVRWFLLCDGRGGITYDDAGNATALEAHVFADVDVAIDLLNECRLSAVFVLLDFLWFSRRRMVNGVQLGGRGPLVADGERRRALLARVFAPILQRCGHEKAIRAWDLLNEPDWIITGFPRLRRRGIAAAELRAFLADAVTLVHTLTDHQATVGSARPSTLPLLSGLGLDFYQLHWYDKLRCRFDLAADVARFGADRPIVLGEFPTRGSRLPPERVLDTARDSGFAGALGWSACVADRHSSAVALRSAIERHLHQC